jgi:hypothetical protein
MQPMVIPFFTHDIPMVFQGINNHPSTARTSSKLLLPGTAGAQQGGQIVNGMQRPIRPGTGPAGNSWSGLRLLDNMGNIGKAGVTYSNLFHVYVHYIYISLTRCKIPSFTSISF